MKKGKVVQIVWEDSASDGGGWHRPCKEAPGTILATSVGVVYKRSKKQIVLIPHSTNRGQALGTVAIPTSAIRKMRRLK